MKIITIKDALEASLIHGNENLNVNVKHIYASDLMSDVLAYGKPDSILLTGLATQQAVISAHISEFKGVVFIRGKIPKDDSLDLAQKNHLVLLSTQYDMYDACIKIESRRSGVQYSQLEKADVQKIEEILLNETFVVSGDDYAHAGSVSTEVKSILKKIGFDPALIRRVAISTYEAEMNVVMHAEEGKVELSVTPKTITVVMEDKGKGIPNIELALQEGYTTATDEMRAMGFGSGMGLPNIKKNCDELNIESHVGKGTRLELMFKI